MAAMLIQATCDSLTGACASVHGFVSLWMTWRYRRASLIVTNASFTREELTIMRVWSALVIVSLLLAMATPAYAGPIMGGGLWYEFTFDGTGSFATDGAGTVPSSGGNSVHADDPPWTFAAGAGGAVLTVTDAFLYGDAFEIFDNAVSIGSTPLVQRLDDSFNSDPAIAVLDPDMSHAAFLLGAGVHSLTIQAIASPHSGGAAYFRIDGDVPTIPAPGALLLVGSGLLGLLPWRRKASR
jgi:hypothetical protein